MNALLEQMIVDAVARPGGFARGAGLGDEGAAAAMPGDVALALELLQRLAHGRARQAMDRLQLVLTRDELTGLPLAALDTIGQQQLELLIERNG
jgi:hypothetical protein